MVWNFILLNFPSKVMGNNLLVCVCERGITTSPSTAVIPMKSVGLALVILTKFCSGLYCKQMSSVLPSIMAVRSRSRSSLGSSIDEWKVTGVPLVSVLG